MPRPAAATMASLLLCSCGQLGWEGDPRAATLEDYRASFERAVGNNWAGTLDSRELDERLQQARVLWLGDHHQDPDLHRLQRELLQRLLQANRRLVLCLEAVGNEDDAALARYVAGRSDLTQLREAVARRWPDSWLDSTEVDALHYRRVLELCRSTRTPVVGLEPAPRLPLRNRDAVIAETVRRTATAEPHRLVVVMVGQTHLLGEGNLIARTGLPNVAIGARPPDELGPAPSPAGAFLRSGSGLLFFRSLVRDR